jgi:hypothetical protein
MLAATEDRMEQQSATGVVFLLALVNACKKAGKKGK